MYYLECMGVSRCDCVGREANPLGLAEGIAKKYKLLFETFDIFWKKISNPKWVKPYYFVEYQSILLVQTLIVIRVVRSRQEL